jgi:hypothetical protein
MCKIEKQNNEERLAMDLETLPGAAGSRLCQIFETEKRERTCCHCQEEGMWMDWLNSLVVRK